MVAIRLLVSLFLVIGLAFCEDKNDESKRPKKDIGLKIKEASAASEQDSNWNNLGGNLDVNYQQPGHLSSFGYQQPNYAGGFGYHQPSYSSYFNYQQPSYGSSFGYQPQISTDSPSYFYKYYKYHYPTTGYNHHTFNTFPQTYSQFSTPQYYNYYSYPSYSNQDLQTDALLQTYSGSYQQSYPDSSSLYSGSTYQQPLTSLYSGSNFHQSLSDNNYQQSYQSIPSTSYQTYPSSNGYSFDYNKAGNTDLSSSLSNSR